MTVNKKKARELKKERFLKAKSPPPVMNETPMLSNRKRKKALKKAQREA